MKKWFDLSAIGNYDPAFHEEASLILYLKNIFVDEGDAIVVSDYLFEDLAELHVDII